MVKETHVPHTAISVKRYDVAYFSFSEKEANHEHGRASSNDAASTSDEPQEVRGFGLFECRVLLLCMLLIYHLSSSPCIRIVLLVSSK